MWWGAVERRPKQYDWGAPPPRSRLASLGPQTPSIHHSALLCPSPRPPAAYSELIELVASFGLKIQAVLSFHACGCNVGDSCTISLPEWVLALAEKNPDLFYTDRSRKRDDEYLSLGVDEEPVLLGRTAVEAYRDLCSSFVDTFQHRRGEARARRSPTPAPRPRRLEARRGLTFPPSAMSARMGSVVQYVAIGLGPAGELRYPSYPEVHPAATPNPPHLPCSPPPPPACSASARTASPAPLAPPPDAPTPRDQIDPPPADGGRVALPGHGRVPDVRQVHAQEAGGRGQGGGPPGVGARGAPRRRRARAPHAPGPLLPTPPQTSSARRRSPRPRNTFPRSYNGKPHETGFFTEKDGSWSQPYGKFFLGWYSGELIAHGDRVLSACKQQFAAFPGVVLMARSPPRHPAIPPGARWGLGRP